MPNDSCVAQGQSEYFLASRKQLLPRLPLLRLKTGLERPDPEDSDTSQLLERLGITPRRYLHHRRNYVYTRSQELFYLQHHMNFCVYLIERKIMYASWKQLLCIHHQKNYCARIVTRTVPYTSSQGEFCVHDCKKYCLCIITEAIVCTPSRQIWPIHDNSSRILQIVFRAAASTYTKKARFAETLSHIHNNAQDHLLKRFRVLSF